MIVSYIQGALRKELLIASFVEPFKDTTLGKTCRLTLPLFETTYLNIAFLTNFLLIKGYVQCTLRKALPIATSVECFETITLGKPYRKILAALEKVLLTFCYNIVK